MRTFRKMFMIQRFPNIPFVAKRCEDWRVYIIVVSRCRAEGILIGRLTFQSLDEFLMKGQPKNYKVARGTSLKGLKVKGGFYNIILHELEWQETKKKVDK